MNNRESNAKMIAPVFTIIETNARCICNTVLIRDGEAMQTYYTARNGQQEIRLCAGCYEVQKMRLLSQRFKITKTERIK